MDVFEMLRFKPGFTTAEMKIADYILAHTKEISKLSAHAVAQGSDFSSASVIRLCQKAGFSGYREFQVALLASLASQKTEVAPGKTLRLDFTGENSFDSFSDVMAKAVDNCRCCISEQTLHHAARLVSTAKRVGLFESSPLNIPSLCHHLNGIGIASFAANFLTEDRFTDDHRMADGTTFVLFHTGAVQPVMRDRLTVLRRHGARMITITYEDNFPETDCLIHFPKMECSAADEEMLYIQTAQLYISSCLLRLLRLSCLEEDTQRSE